MATYGISEFKVNISAVLREVKGGEEVTITRHGKPCAKLTPVSTLEGGKASLESLRGSLTYLPDADYEDFMDIKGVWEPRIPPNCGLSTGMS